MSKRLMVPAGLYGRRTEVARAARRMATGFLKGASLEEVVADQSWIDMAEVAGYIVISGALDGEHFFGAELVEALFRKLDDDREATPWERFFSELLPRPWALACCLGEGGYHLVEPEGRAERYVRAIVDQWDALTAPGARYALGIHPGSLWGNANLLWFALSRLGASREELDAEADLEPRAMPALLRRYGGA